MAQELWIIEASFIANGIRYGFTGDRLREYVEKRLQQCEEFEERSARRQEGALRPEFDEKLKNLKKMNERIASSTYEGAKRDLLATRERTPDKAWKTLLTDKQRSEEYSKPVGGSDPRPTGSVQCMVTSVGDAQKQLESRPNDVEAQELEAQELEAQELEAQELEAQELEARDLEAQGVEAEKTRRATLVSTEEVNGEIVWNTEIGCVSSGSAPTLGRSSVPVTVSCVTAHISELGESISCVLSGPASAPCRSGSVTVSCATAHSGKLREIKLAKVVGISDILPWPPPQQKMTRSKPQIV